MPAPLAKGIIITVSVLFAAGLAAYENPQIREWIDRSRQKIAMALHSLGDDIHPRSISPSRHDASMHEDMTDHARARRRQAVAELMERGRVMEERRRHRRETLRSSKTQNGKVVKSVDRHPLNQEAAIAWTTSADIGASTASVLHQDSDRDIDSRESAGSNLPLEQQGLLVSPLDNDGFESRYVEEMRNAWSMHSLDLPAEPASSHGSGSLLDLTPTSEFAPDPDFSIPQSQARQQHPGSRSLTSRTMSSGSSEYFYAHPENPFEPFVPPTSFGSARAPSHIAVSSASSVADSVDLIDASDVEGDGDSAFSEIEDGVRTPASAWTEVESVVSGQ